MKDILNLLPPGKQGNTMLEIAECLKRIGLTVEGRRDTFEQLTSSSFPVIAHVASEDGAHFMVLEGFDSGFARVLDDIGRRRLIAQEEFRRLWDGTLLTVARTKEWEPLPAYSRSVQTAEPRIQFRTLFCDKGELDDSKETVDFVYDFKNLGKGDLSIKNVRTSCTCTVGGKPQGPVPPGAIGTIHILFKKGKAEGPFAHDAFIESNDLLFPVIKVVLAGNAAQKVKVYPPTLRLGSIVSGDHAAGVAFIRYTGDAPLVLSQANSPFPQVKPECTALSDAMLRNLLPNVGRAVRRTYENVYAVRVNVDTGDAPLGKLSGRITCKTNLAKYPEVSIPLEVEVVAPIAIQPKVLFLGEVDDGDEIEQTVKLSSVGDMHFTVESVECDIPQLCCDHAVGPASDIDLRFRGIVNASSKWSDTKVRVRVKDSASARCFTLEIPVYAYVKDNGKTTMR